MPPIAYPNGICLPGLQRTFVSVDGELYMCEKINEKLPIGTLAGGYDTGAILGIIEQYIEISGRACLDCWANRFCSLCFALAVKGRSLNKERKNGYCGGIRKGVSGALMSYCELMEASPANVRDAFPEKSDINTLALAWQCLEQTSRGAGAS